MYMYVYNVHVYTYAVYYTGYVYIFYMTCTFIHVSTCMLYYNMQRERTDAKKKVKGGPFKLNSHASEYFDDKPYRSDKPLPPLRDPRAAKVKFNPFKPSSPAKLVRTVVHTVMYNHV